MHKVIHTIKWRMTDPIEVPLPISPTTLEIDKVASQVNFDSRYDAFPR